MFYNMVQSENEGEEVEDGKRVRERSGEDSCGRERWYKMRCLPKDEGRREQKRKTKEKK